MRQSFLCLQQTSQQNKMNKLNNTNDRLSPSRRLQLGSRGSSCHSTLSTFSYKPVTKEQAEACGAGGGLCYSSSLKGKMLH